MIKRLFFLALAIGCLRLFPAAASPATHVILAGSGGDQEYRERFKDWGLRLQRLLVEDLGQPGERVHLLMEDPEDGSASSLENLRKTLAESAATHPADKPFFLYIIGHGSFLRGEAKVHLPGPDLSAESLAEMVLPIRATPLVILNSASAGAGFINVLSGPDRILASATKSVREQNATEFMEFFIEGLEQGIADRDRDQRISILEACAQAASLTQAWYLSKGLIATEHAILDDNGDGLGTRLLPDTPDPARTPPRGNADAGAGPRDGTAAMACFLRDFVFSPAVPPSLVEDYLAVLKQVEGLKIRKTSMSSQNYLARLEGLLLQAARLHRRIRDLDNPEP